MVTQETDALDRCPPAHLTDQFASLYEHMQEGVAFHELVYDERGRPADYRLIDVNRQYEVHTGLRKQDIVGRLASEIYGVEEPPYLDLFAAVALGGPAQLFDVYFAPLDRHFCISVAPLGPGEFATIFSDITVRKKQSDAIEYSRMCLRALLDNLPHSAWLKDAQGRYLAVNRAFAAALGYDDPDALVGMSDFDLFDAEQAQATVSDDELAMRDGARCYARELAAPGAKRGWVEVHKSPLRGADGSVTGTAGIARDITEQRRAEEARKDSEYKFSTVFDLAPDSIVVTLPTGEIVDVNRAFCHATGRSREELQGRTVTEMGILKDPEIFGRSVERLESEGHLEGLEVALVSKDGTERLLETSGVLAMFEGSRVIITASRDITEARRAEALAENAREELARYFESSQDLLTIAKTDGTLLRINPAWERVLGRSMVDLAGSSLFDLVHPDDREATLRATEQLAAGKPLIGFQNRYRHADGAYRWLEWSSTPGRGDRIYAVARDITQRYEAEVALRTAERRAARSREQLLRAAELGHIGYFTVDFDTGEVTWTPELYRIFGLEPDSCPPSLELGASFVHPDDAEQLNAVIRHVRRNRADDRCRLRIVRRTGEVRYCLAIIESDSESSAHDRILGLVQDLSDLKRAEEDQRKLEQRVMESQKLESLGVLAGGISHDYNNLLTSILGNAELALGELPAASPAAAYLRDIEQVSRRAADLCRQLLAYSGKGRFVVQSISLNDLVREMSHLLSVSISKKVQLRCEFTPELPSVIADTTQIRQIVMNLITNASEAIGESSGVVTLSTGVVHCDAKYLTGVVGDNDPRPEGEYVYLEVSDTGCGMDAETLRRIFDPFFTTKFTGRGLGLAAVMGIVRGHKGALRVLSEKGRGTVFTVLLPAHHQPAESLEGARRDGFQREGHGLILLADDEESIRNMVTRLLTKAGFEVLAAVDGRQALELFEQHHGAVRLVILDMTMPHLDGEACFHEMRRISPKVKVVMTSGYDEQEVIARFVGKNLAGFVQKPYRASDLLPKIWEVIGDPSRA